MFHITCKSQNGVVKSFFLISTPTATRASQRPAARCGRGAGLGAPALPVSAVREEAPGTAGGLGSTRPDRAGEGAQEAAGRASGDCAGGAAASGSRARSQGQGPGAASREQQVGRGRGKAAGRRPEECGAGGPRAPRR